MEPPSGFEHGTPGLGIQCLDLGHCSSHDDTDCVMMMMILTLTDYEVEGNVKSAKKLNETLRSTDCSPLKKIRKDKEVGYGKRKFTKAKDQLASSFSDVIPGLDNLTICNDCDVLMRQVKEKLDKCHTREERIQFLTLIPEHWSRERTVSFFNVTEYMVRTARNLTKEKGILGIPDSIHRHVLSDELLARVKSFYEEDQIRPMCAGKKDFVTIKSSHGTKEHHQKRLIFAILEQHIYSTNQHSLMTK